MKHDALEFEQLNSQTPVESEVEESFSLEEIMKEFGGWTKPEPEELTEEESLPQPEPHPEPQSVPEQIPETDAPQAEEEARQEVEAEPEPEDSLDELVKKRLPSVPKKEGQFRFTDMSGDTIRFRVVSPEEAEDGAAEPYDGPGAVMPEEPARQVREKHRTKRRLRRRERRRKRALRRAERARRWDEPEVVYPSAEEACAAYAKGGTLRPRLLLSLILTAASAVLLYFYETIPGGAVQTDSGRGLSVAMVALFLLQALLSREVLVRGVQQVIRLKPDLSSVMTVSAVLAILDSFRAIVENRLPLCPVIAVSLLLALWSVSLEKQAKWRTLKTVLAMDAPVAAVKEEKAWHDLDCIFRREGNLEDFTAMLEIPDAAQKTMRIYAPAALLLTLALAVFSAVRGGADFLWSWAVLAAAALPAGGFLACWRPFAILARRLQKAGAAVCGWRGAKILSGEAGLVIRDDDLFPESNISINGVKMFSEMPVRQVVGYATAVIQAADSGLLPLFEELMKNENGRRYTVDTFRQYEGGGLGAEIRGDVVLLGSMGFMRLMGVHVPEGARIQSAIYVSVNSELMGVFALTYGPSAASKVGLQSVVRTPGLLPILATRDFMITPGLVKKRFKVSADRLEFPVVAERTRLSDRAAGENGRQGALMARGSFAGFAAAVTGGRSLRKTVHGSVVVSLLAGVLGMLLLCVLTYLDAAAAASASNLLLYQLLWQVPTLLITGMIGKS